MSHRHVTACRATHALAAAPAVHAGWRPVAGRGYREHCAGKWGFGSGAPHAPWLPPWRCPARGVIACIVEGYGRAPASRCHLPLRAVFHSRPLALQRPPCAPRSPWRRRCSPQRPRTTSSRSATSVRPRGRRRRGLRAAVSTGVTDAPRSLARLPPCPHCRPPATHAPLLPLSLLLVAGTGDSLQTENAAQINKHCATSGACNIVALLGDNIYDGEWWSSSSAS